MTNVRTLDTRVGYGWMRAATHCVNGHEFTPENTHWNEEGWRRCRTCHRARRKAKRQEVSQCSA